jgi:hypothetical protein
MENPPEKLDAFIEAAKSKGAPDETLAGLLRDRGWAAKEVSAAFGRYYEKLTGVAAPVRNARSGEAARDAFLYLLSFSMLGTWATALGVLLFDYYDRWFPDPLARGGYAGSRWDISWQLACIIVAFPVYLLVTRAILRGLELAAQKTDSGVRKWLTYMALLITAGILVGDLITFLSYFFNGELTVRFVLKVLTVLAIAGSIFWYYVGTLKERGEHVQA